MCDFEDTLTKVTKQSSQYQLNLHKLSFSAFEKDQTLG